MRQPYPGWFKDFVTNQDSLIEQGGPYIKAVINFSPVEYSHSFQELDSTQISSLLEYFEK